MSRRKTQPPAPGAKQPQRFRVWSAVTVFVQAEGDRSPWTKRSRTAAVSVTTGDYDAAMHAGEREMAREMARRFGMVK